MRCDLGSKVELGRVAEESSRCQMENNDLRLKVDTRATAGHMHVYVLCTLGDAKHVKVKVVCQL